MGKERFEQALSALDPSKRALLKRIVVGAAFAVPIISSFPVKDLAFGQVGSGDSSTSFTTTFTITVSTITQ